MNNLVDVEAVLKEVWNSNNYNVINKSALYRISQNPTFIHPKMRIVKSSTNVPFIIVSAPGAVGKTTFAKYASYSKKGYYWDLSKTKLGDNTFIGTIAQTFGAKNLSNILDDINKGRTSFFLDAFDEAEMVSGWDGVEKFVKEIYSYCSASTIPNIVLFSRAETTLLLQILLEELGGINIYSMYEIDYFDEISSKNFVKKYLEQNGDASYLRFTEPFDAAMNNIFATIGKGMNNNNKNDIWEDIEIRSFIGYSPVLQTIGSFLLHQNFEEVANKFDTTKTAEGGLKVITQFINELLKREQQKLIQALKHRELNIPSLWNNWEELYLPEEQLRILIIYLSENKSFKNIITNEGKIPDWLLPEYRNCIESFINNHPFLKNGEFGSPAFRDYTLGYLFNSEYGQACQDYFKKESFVLTPLFAYFYSKKNNNKCMGTHAGYIYESAASKIGVEGNSLLTYIKLDDSGKYILEILNSEKSKFQNIEMECIIEENIPLIFERRLYNASIKIEGQIILGRFSSSIELSDVDIKAKKISLRSKECFLNCHDNSEIKLVATEFEQEDYSLVLKKNGNGNVQVNWPTAQIYPWAQYYQEISQRDIEEFEDILFDLKRILIPFRKHGKGEFAKQFEFIDNIIVKGSENRKALLDYLINVNIIEKRAPYGKYFLIESALKQNGMNWADLKGMNPNTDLLRFLKEYKTKRTILNSNSISHNNRGK